MIRQYKTVWLHVIIMSRTSFRVNPHSIVCLNVRELVAQSRRHILSLGDSNVIRTHNHLVRKRTLKHLAKLPWVFVYKLSGCGFESRCCHKTVYLLNLHTNCIFSRSAPQIFVFKRWAYFSFSKFSNSWFV